MASNPNMSFRSGTHMNIHGGTFNDVGRDLNIHPNSFDLTKALNPVPNAGHNRNDRIAGCMKGTREAIIATIEKWIDEGSDRPICWLNGPAGYGKSAIAQTIADRCAASNKLGASFFFLRGAGDRSKITHFLPTLAYQLSLSFPTTKPYIQSVLERDPLIVQQSLGHQFRQLVINSVMALVEPIRPIVIVIDALDECDDKNLIADFLEVLSCAINDHRLPFQFFITSRIEEHIRIAFDVTLDHSATHLLALQNFHADADIQAFLQSRFSTIYKEQRRVMTDVPQPWPSNWVLKELVEKSSG